MRTRFIWLRLCVMASAVLTMSTTARAVTRVELLDTYPAGETVGLAPGQPYFLHLRCSADHPARIWVRPTWHGRDAPAATNGMLPCAAGTEVLGWFSVTSADGAVDLIEVLSDETSRAGTLALRVPVVVSRSASAGKSDPEPEWVARLEAEARLRRQSEREATNESGSLLGSIAFAIVMALLCALAILGLVLPLRAWWTWQGSWRRAALLPLGLMTFVLVRLIIGVSLDPTSHNLWPFEIAFTGGLSAAGMLLLTRLRRAAERRVDPPAR